MQRRPSANPCQTVTYSRTPLPRTALYSYPGSGNTWLRHLIQQATGIATGSVYRDYALKLYGFPGEGVANTSVIAVKTHEWGPQERAKFDRCVLIIREPYGALLAEFNRRHAGHRGHATSSNFGRAWREFVYARSRDWQKMNFDWLQFDGPLHVIRYENLMTDLLAEMRKLLTFLGTRVSNRDFSCMMKNSEGLFHRTDAGGYAKDHYDNKMVHLIDSIWTNMTEYLNSRFINR
ncbi:WSCD family member AAEL009094-like [Liolophura sinensis]|uniref:WSCD family member AAEL009094-like n=1 Tax=Liolophura sinensis TaxID=3198878 RepID=UPI00315850D8